MITPTQPKDDGGDLWVFLGFCYRGAFCALLYQYFCLKCIICVRILRAQQSWGSKGSLMRLCTHSDATVYTPLCVHTRVLNLQWYIMMYLYLLVGRPRNLNGTKFSINLVPVRFLPLNSI